MAEKKEKVFDPPADTTPEAVKMAHGFLAEANVVFTEQVEKTEDLVRRFWYRNRNNDGEGSLNRVEKLDDDGKPIPGEYESDEPTGIEIMEAMGTRAEAAYTIAVARAMMLVSISDALGRPGLLDRSKIAGPYELKFNDDGSLKKADRKEEPEPTPEPEPEPTPTPDPKPKPLDPLKPKL